MNNLFLGDCADVMRKSIADESIDLVVTSPPYDNLRHYGGDASLTEDKFQDVAKELYRVVKNGGVVVWLCGLSTTLPSTAPRRVRLSDRLCSSSQ